MDLTLLDKPVADIAIMMVSDLRQLDAAIDAESARLKARKEALHAALARRFEEQAKAQLVKQGKDTGTTTIVANDVTLKVEVPKKVDWDTTKLLAIANTLKPEDARHFIKLDAKVDERKFTAATPELQQLLSPARTVKAGKPSFKFSESEAA